MKVHQKGEVLHFGTDGWRDTIGGNFTAENVRFITLAICDYLRENTGVAPQLVVGYDTRKFSQEFAKEAALVASGNGVLTYLTESFTPTPVVSLATLNRKADGAVVITASHNPPKYNGVKFKTKEGGSASPEVTLAIENKCRANLAKGIRPRSINFDEAQKKGLLRLFDPKEEYLSHILSLIDKELVENSKIKAIADPMHGATIGYLVEALNRVGCEAIEIHGESDTSFGGMNPEPIDKNLGVLKEEVKKRNYDVGFAADGDGDRIGAVDEYGNFVDSHKIFALLLKHLVDYRGWRGKVIKTVTTTQMINNLAQKYGLQVVEVPVGFKYICEHMLKGDVLIGGEESGGIGIRAHIPERDGIFLSLMIAEAMAASQKSLSQLVEEAQSDAGFFCYERYDEEVNSKTKSRLSTYLKAHGPEQIGEAAVVEINNLDGHKFWLADSSWVMLRASGTENVVRIYAEAPTYEKARALIEEGKRILSQVT